MKQKMTYDQAVAALESGRLKASDIKATEMHCEWCARNWQRFLDAAQKGTEKKDDKPRR